MKLVSSIPNKYKSGRNRGLIDIRAINPRVRVLSACGAGNTVVRQGPAETPPPPPGALTTPSTSPGRGGGHAAGWGAGAGRHNTSSGKL